MTTLRSGSNNIFAGNATAVANVDAADTIDSADIRKAVAKLRSNKAKARRGSLYWTGNATMERLYNDEQTSLY